MPLSALEGTHSETVARPNCRRLAMIGGLLICLAVLGWQAAQPPLAQARKAEKIFIDCSGDPPPPKLTVIASDEQQRFQTRAHTVTNGQVLGVVLDDSGPVLKLITLSGNPLEIEVRNGLSRENIYVHVYDKNELKHTFHLVAYGQKAVFTIKCEDAQ